MPVSITLPDGGQKTFDSPPSGLKVAQSIGARLSKDAVGFTVEGTEGIQDIRSPLKDGDRVKIVACPSKEALEVIRHSSAHVLAQAVQNLWPEVKVTIGPVIEEGFYYDFETDKKFTPEDLSAVEKEMKKILKAGYEVTREIWPVEKALKHFGEKGETLKQEIIRDLEEKEVSVYKQGDWLDLCKGPHVQKLSQIGAVKVLSHSGAYWRGDSKNKQLQRIYGTAFHSEKDLKAYLKKREEALQNDHRVLGKKLDLFWFSETAPGQPFFTPSGTAVYQKLQKFLREKYREWGYEEVITPQVYHSDLFQQSGHFKHFADNMYAVSDGSKEPDKGFLKPMNCPGHCLLYKKDRKSYRDLPYRMADFGRLHRNEPAGALHGLTRVRAFCQDDAHIFCRMERLSGEIQAGIKMLQEIYRTLGLSNYTIQLSTRPEERMGEDELWDQAEQALRDSLTGLKLPFQVNPGDGAFYGPKLDISVRDSFDRAWQLGTFQCDFNLPKAFDLSYTNEKGGSDRPVLVHRAVLGSLERFIGVYLEHRKGRLPLWLSPDQALVLPLTDRERDFSKEIQIALAQSGISCKIDDRSEKISYKIRQAQLLQIPYMIIIGRKEKENGSVSLRLREGNRFEGLPLKTVQDTLPKEIQSKSLHSLFLKNKDNSH